MITLCWAAKGGSGTSVVAAALALAAPRPTLLVDLDGDQPDLLGCGHDTRPGVYDWLASGAPTDRLAHLERPVSERLALLPAGRPAGEQHRPERWHALALALTGESRDVIVDAGTGVPPPALAAAAPLRWLVTRPCYLALRLALRVPSSSVGPTGVVLVDEPGRALRAGDVECSLGVPVVATLLCDPAVARAVDAGLVHARLPAVMRRALRGAAEAA